MSEAQLNRWNERFRHPEYAYGVEPNEFLKQGLEKLPVGKILFPAEGEGRNAVFAAKLGWDVFAFDTSSFGRDKAIRLAKKNDVTINYEVGELEVLPYKENEFDAIALIFAHFPAEINQHITNG